MTRPLEGERDGCRLRLAVPGKGRLAEPALALLREAGFRFEPAARRLFAPCENFEMDLLYVRTEDIAEYTQDGVVDMGITGSNLVLESGAEVEERLELGFGRCSLQVAVPQDAEVTEVGQLAGSAIATSHPRTTARFLREKGVSARLIEVRGSVEVAPLLGVAGAIVDLVATGSTLATNGLRPIATVLASQAVLIANPRLEGETARRRDLVQTALASVVEAGRRKYLMLNVQRSALERVRRIIPGLGAPTVMELATPGMIAVHAVVDADLVWNLLGPLKAAGASSILVMQIENLIP
ncbi:MAG: ATP phosphoribosyltransferase [Candidatus Dormibacterales bacterium]